MDLKNVPIVIYRNWLAMFTALNSDQVGQIMQAVASHVLTGEELEVDGELRTLATQIIQEVDESIEKYTERCEKNKQNIAKRYERNTNVQPTNNERNTNVLPSKTKTKTKTTNSQGELDCGESASSNPTPQRKQIPPKKEWVIAYFIEQEFNSEPEAFFDYWEARGWRTKNGLMRDWQASARTWHRNESTFTAPNLPTPKQTQPAIEPMSEYLERKRREALANGNNNVYQPVGNLLTGLPESGQ